MIAIIIVGVVLISILCGIYYTEFYNSSTPSPTPPPGGSPGPSAPPGAKPNVCTEKDSTKCCNSSKKCTSSEVACQCTAGESYDCTTNKCIPNCVCANGTPATGADCGDKYGINKCTNCNATFTLGNASTRRAGTFAEDKNNNITCIKKCGDGGKNDGSGGGGACRGGDHCCRLKTSDNRWKCCVGGNTCGSGWDAAWRCNSKADSYTPNSDGSPGKHS